MSDKVEKKEVLCVRCPKGCKLELEIGEKIEVKNNECKLGIEHGKQEARDPKRVVPTTVKVKGARWPRLPVRTEEAISLEKVEEVISELEGTTVEAPIQKGEVIVEKVADTSASIIAERDMERVG